MRKNLIEYSEQKIEWMQREQSYEDRIAVLDSKVKAFKDSIELIDDKITSLENQEKFNNHEENTNSYVDKLSDTDLYNSIMSRFGNVSAN